ncbi:MAG: glycosyltransferase family 2 protein [Nostocaceae cyanobacterium]|nr:glycosyltransferase family 2 protein [Nostocaceae cyanobacterium]
MFVSVCIITYQRPEGLKRLMDGLSQLTFNNIEVPQIEVVVIDNDSAGSAVKFCEKIKSKFKWSLKTGIEPQRGISYARNRAIATADKNADFIAMIDDDEVPEPQWLEQLLLVQQEYNADVVAAPVLPHFQDDVPNWAKKGKFFDPERYSTGAEIDVAYSGNVLIRNQVLQKLDKIFDERFALTGGEDSHLFMRLYHAGYKLVWADEAIAHEWIPNSRINVQWILRRGYRTWSSHSLIERELYPSMKVQGIRVVKGTALIIIGLLLLIPYFFFRGYHGLIRALLYIYRGSGTFAGLLGIHYQEYQNIGVAEYSYESGIKTSPRPTDTPLLTKERGRG